jgi:uncharacterized protein YacL
MNIIIVGLLLIILLLLIQAQGYANLSFLKSHKRKIILDSCALIDGRIVDLVRTGFVADELVIPKFILSELQMLADGNDAHKRERARFGLEVAAELREYSWVHVTVDETKFPGVPAVDDRLIALGKKISAVLCTTDYNLNKVASIEGVKVLNINDLAQNLRPSALPGEKLEIQIVQKGSNAQQGVGYLEDGTMIVVDGAAKLVGTKAAVIVDRMHQTVAGKMVFGHATAQTVARSHTPAKTVAKTAANKRPVVMGRSRLAMKQKQTAKKLI